MTPRYDPKIKRWVVSWPYVRVEFATRLQALAWLTSQDEYTRGVAVSAQWLLEHKPAVP